MASFKMLDIDNSKKAAVNKGKWKNPGASLYDQLLNSLHVKGDIPTDPKELKEAIKNGDYKDWTHFLKEAYAVAPVDKISNNPHGVTPFSRSGCKYPHHVIRGDKLVVSIPGLRSAYICARNQGVLVNHTPENKAIVAHFNRHFKELGLKPVWHHGEFYLMEEHEVKIAENFDHINQFIFEQSGINLFPDDYPSPGFMESTIEGSKNHPVLSSDFNQEVGEKTPEALYNWMHENIEYDKTIHGWKLRDAAQLYIDKKGNCHDQAYFEAFILNSWGYNARIMFFVEYKLDSDVGGNTHSLCYYCTREPDSKYYWFENAWEDYAGIHGPYDSIDDIKTAVLNTYNEDNDINSHEFDGIVFGTRSNFRIGMSLGEYVESWKLEDDHLFSKKEAEVSIKESLNWIENFVHNEVFRESVIRENESNVKSVSDLLKKCRTPEELLEWMNCIEYGWIDQSGKKCGTGEEDNNDHMWAEYKLQSPLQLIRSKIGVCWDQCELERAWFEKQRYPFTIVYMEIDDDEGKPSHTFLIFKEPGETSEVSWFEHSWGQERGIHKFSDLQQCLLTITQKFRASQNLPKSPMTLNKIDMHPPYGSKVIPYMDYAHKQFPVDMGDLQYDDIFNEATFIFQSGDFDQYKTDDDLLDTSVEDLDEAAIGAYKNGVLEIPVSNTKYKARVEQLIRRYGVSIDSSNIILVIRGREDFIDNMTKDCGYTRRQAEYEFDQRKLHGYIMSDNPLYVNITERKYAVGGFNKSYGTLILHECTHSIVYSIPQKRPLTENFQEGIAIYESGMLKHMLEKFRKAPTIGGRKYYPPLLRSTIQVSNIIKEKGYNYLINIIKGSIPEPSYDDFIHESGFKYNGSSISKLSIFNEDKYFKILKSDLDSDYEPKGHKSLSDFTKVHITNELTKKFKDQGKLIKWMRDQNPKYGDDCWLWIDDDDDYVGAITYDQEYDENHHKWISGIDVAYKYMGYGIGKQLLEEAIKAGANALDVQKDNEVALRMYEKRGFKISEESRKKVDSGKSVTYEMFLDEPSTYINNDPPAGRASMKVCYIDPHTKKAHLYPNGYDRPLVFDLLPDHLKNDEVHSWRAKYGIELIHKEPTIDELQRIWGNWQIMSDNMKRISDQKSIELFSKNNEDHYHDLISELDDGNFIEATDDFPPNISDESKDESMPKKTDSAESSKNGVRRKKLYVAFIEWAKEFNSKNTFGSIFDKDIFHNVYPFVPEEMRYFYRLANPILCVLAGDLTFFQVSELKKLNAGNKEIDKLLIFAATPNDLRVFNREDKRIYIGTEENEKIQLGESIGETFDMYIQKMINKGDILNGTNEAESAE